MHIPHSLLAHLHLQLLSSVSKQERGESRTVLPMELEKVEFNIATSVRNLNGSTNWK